MVSPTMPLFIIANTGGAADWLTWACRNISSEMDNEEITNEFLKRFKKTYSFSESDATKFCNEMKKIVTEKGDYVSTLKKEIVASRKPWQKNLGNFCNLFFCKVLFVLIFTMYFFDFRFHFYTCL